MKSERRARLEAAGWQFADTPEEMFEQWWGKAKNKRGRQRNEKTSHKELYGLFVCKKQ
jgi:hypothetical protein